MPVPRKVQKFSRRQSACCEYVAAEALLRESKLPRNDPNPTGPSPTDRERLWSAKLGHPIQHVARELRLDHLPTWSSGSQTIAENRFVPEEGILHAGLAMVFRAFRSCRPSEVFSCRLKTFRALFQVRLQHAGAILHRRNFLSVYVELFRNANGKYCDKYDLVEQRNRRPRDAEVAASLSHVAGSRERAPTPSSCGVFPAEPCSSRTSRSWTPTVTQCVQRGREVLHRCTLNGTAALFGRTCSN